MDWPAVLWLSRTDVSCDKRLCRCHARRADTLHTLLTAGFPLSVPPFLDGTTAVPKWIPNESICQGLFAAGLDLMLLLCTWRDGISLREPRAAGGQHLPGAGLVAPKHILNKQKSETDKGWTYLSPSNAPSFSDSSTHPCICVTEAKSFSHLSLISLPSARCSSFHFLRHSCIYK